MRSILDVVGQTLKDSFVKLTALVALGCICVRVDNDWEARVGFDVVIEQGKELCVRNDGVDVSVGEDVGYVFMLEPVIDSWPSIRA